MTKEIEEVKKAIKLGKYRVRDVNVVRQYLKRGHCRQETYDRLTEIIADVGALIIPFREHPEVKKILEKKGQLNIS
ncbi:hypothetical protein ES704_02701 [subsurface metagenome]|jgi:hypothetical protein